MDVLYFDSSALVKRYVNETGSAWVLGLVDPSSGNEIYVARITAVEVVSAITRRQRSGGITPDDAAALLVTLRHDLAHQYRIIEIAPAMVASAMSLAETHAIRGYDAVQLAAAIEVNLQCQALGTTMTLVSADVDLNAASVAEGLTVEDPNAHP